MLLVIFVLYITIARTVTMNVGINSNTILLSLSFLCVQYVFNIYGATVCRVGSGRVVVWVSVLSLNATSSCLSPTKQQEQEQEKRTTGWTHRTRKTREEAKLFTYTYVGGGVETDDSDLQQITVNAPPHTTKKATKSKKPREEDREPMPENCCFPVHEE